jgi:hypothetical protein
MPIYPPAARPATHPCGANIRFLHELGKGLVDEGDAGVDEALGLLVGMVLR